MGGVSPTNHDGAADTGSAKEGAIFDYIAYTVKISEMAEDHLWPSVMAFVTANYNDNLRAVNLKPRVASKVVTGAMSV